MLADPKFRNDSSYIFFILLVKELIHLKRCKMTFLRQATQLPNLTKEDIMTIEKKDLSRYNRGYQAFKLMRGTAPYFEESKKNLMAILRQQGCPTIFMTLSSAEFDWPDLLREIVETVERRKVSENYLNEMSPAEKNRIIAENVVQSTLHFQKRIEKIFSLVQGNFFDVDKEFYCVSSYFYRIEFQQRGAPHVHSLLWLKSKDGNDAPNYWTENVEPQMENQYQAEIDRFSKIEKFTDFLISTSPENISCVNHDLDKKKQDSCSNCKVLKEKVKKFQTHYHTHTCAKKKKTITIKSCEGFGRNDGIQSGPTLKNIPVCRFKFPKFPMDETKVVKGTSNDTDESEVHKRKEDLSKIVKFLVRQTYTETDLESLESWQKIKEISFFQFLFEGFIKEGLFDTMFKSTCELDKKDL